jgi:hypothetical protein
MQLLAHILHSPSVAVSRDLYKRAYGRNVDDFIKQLEGIRKRSPGLAYLLEKKFQAWQKS